MGAYAAPLSPAASLRVKFSQWYTPPSIYAIPARYALMKNAQAPKWNGGQTYMGWLGEFFYQILSVFLFAVSLGFMFYFLSEKQQVPFLWCAFLSWTFAGAALFLFLNQRVLIEPETGGTLLPARDQTPSDPINCPPIPQGAMRVFLGSSLAYTNQQSFDVIRVRADSLLSVKRGKDGIYINARIFSRDRRLVAEIKENKFHINPNNYFKRERPDKHTLIVYDQEGREVLNARYLNPLALKFTGLFFYPNLPPIAIEENRLLIQGNTIANACLGNAATVIQIN